MRFESAISSRQWLVVVSSLTRGRRKSRRPTESCHALQMFEEEAIGRFAPPLLPRDVAKAALTDWVKDKERRHAFRVS